MLVVEVVVHMLELLAQAVQVVVEGRKLVVSVGMAATPFSAL